MSMLLPSEGGGCSGKPGGSKAMPLLLSAEGGGCSGKPGGSDAMPLLLAAEGSGNWGSNPGGASSTELSLELAVRAGCGWASTSGATLGLETLKPVGGLCLAVLSAWCP